MEKLRTGLKKGDYFEDGGRFFVVDDVLENGNYISHRVSAEEAAEKKVEAKAPAKTFAPFSSESSSRINSCAPLP